MPEHNDNVMCQGSVYFQKKGSSASYTLEIDLDYIYNNINYHLHIIGSNQYVQPNY